MAQAEVIKEFLVALGFKTDEKGLKDFTSGIEHATKNVVKLVAAIEAAALTVGAGVAAFASNLEQLYFAAKKTGSSATNIRSFEKAVQSFGVTADEASGSLQGLARWMRNNPGSDSILRSLGVETHKANGELRDMAEIMADVGKEMSKKPYYLAMDWSKDLGISEDTMRAIMNGDFEAKFAASKKRNENTGFEKAAEDAHRFMEGMRELTTYLEAFGIKVQDALMNKLGMSMNQFSDWFQKNGPMIADRVADLIVQFMTLAEKIGPALVWLINKLIELDKSTNGWSTKIIAALALINLLGGSAVIGGIISLAGAFGKLGGSIAAATLGGGSLMAVMGKLGLLGVAGAAGWQAGTLIHDALSDDTNDAIGATVATILAKLGIKNAQEALDADMNARAGLTGGGGARPSASAGRTNSVKLAALEQRYGLPSGLLDSVWAAESGRGKNMRSRAGAQGHFQFMPDTAKQYGLTNPDDFDQSSDAAARYYRDLIGRYGGNLENAVAAYNWGPGNVDRKGLGAAPPETRNYIDRVRGGMGGQSAGSTISQNTQITVYGTEAEATGRAVAREQERINQAMARNMNSPAY